MTDTEAIRKVVETYMTSWYRGDHAAMADCLHGSLIKRRLAQDREGGPRYLNCLQRDEMIAATEAGLGLGDAARFDGVEIEVHAIHGDIASAQARAGRWFDLLQLVRGPDGWRILHCLYAPT